MTTDIDGLNSNQIIITPYDPAIHDGIYTVTVIVDGCEATSADNEVDVQANPIANPSATTGTICHDGSLELFANAADAISYLWQGPNGFTSTLENPVIAGVDVTYNGTYVLSVYNINGCNSKGEVQVINILQPAEVPTITVNGPNCEGDDMILSTSTAGQLFEWIGPLGASTGTLAMSGLTTTVGTTTLDPSNPAYMSGEWSVRVTDANGCIATSAPINVEINPVPVAIPSNDGPICEGEGNITLFASTVNNGEYLWYDADPAAGGNLVSTDQTFVLNNPIAGMTDYYLVVSLSLIHISEPTRPY